MFLNIIGFWQFVWACFGCFVNYGSHWLLIPPMTCVFGQSWPCALAPSRHPYFATVLDVHTAVAIYWANPYCDKYASRHRGWLDYDFETARSGAVDLGQDKYNRKGNERYYTIIILYSLWNRTEEDMIDCWVTFAVKGGKFTMMLIVTRALWTHFDFPFVVVWIVYAAVFFCLSDVRCWTLRHGDVSISSGYRRVRITNSIDS